MDEDSEVPINDDEKPEEMKNKELKPEETKVNKTDGTSRMNGNYCHNKEIKQLWTFFI